MRSTKVAVVTGANKGIGYAIVKGLCENFTGDVYLTARNEILGTKAIESLEQIGLKPLFHLLDITKQESINTFKNFLSEKYGGLDILVNNAAIAFPVQATEPFGFQATETLNVNYFSLKNVCDALFPLLRPHARVVNVSSSAGHLSFLPNKHLKAKFSSPTLTVDELDDLMKQFEKCANDGTWEQKGWPTGEYNDYAVSKIGVTALTFIQQREFDKDSTREDIIVNSVHPGYVITDMTNNEGHLTIYEGARSSLYAALVPANAPGPKGEYIKETCEVADWTSDERPLT